MPPEMHAFFMDTESIPASAAANARASKQQKDVDGVEVSLWLWWLQVAVWTCAIVAGMALWVGKRDRAFPPAYGSIQ